MTQFSDLNLDPKVLQAVAESGYTTPTPIQAGAIPPRFKGAMCSASRRPAPARRPASCCR